VNIDYHVEVDGHYYSVPYKYARQQLDARLSQTTVECFHGSRRIASHLRSLSKGRHTTLIEHMPRAHREYAEWTPERITRWAADSGPFTAELARRIIESRDHPEQGYRTCLGILRLGKAYSAERLEAAAERALAIGALNYKSIESILKNRLDMQPLPSTPQLDAEASSTPIEHENIRGSLYYSLNTLNGDTNQCC
jgi:transposase